MSKTPPVLSLQGNGMEQPMLFAAFWALQGAIIIGDKTIILLL
jgi:hypothetical protein